MAFEGLPTLAGSHGIPAQARARDHYVHPEFLAHLSYFWRTLARRNHSEALARKASRSAT